MVTAMRNSPLGLGLKPAAVSVRPPISGDRRARHPGCAGLRVCCPKKMLPNVLRAPARIHLWQGAPRQRRIQPFPRTSNANSKDIGSDLAEEYSTQTAPYSRQLLPAEYGSERGRRIPPRLLKSQRPLALGAIIQYSTAF